jgi:plasmid stabilization system protein ParE
MKPIEIRAEAELDIIEAALWYESEREGFGAKFSHEVERAVARIAENPRIFQEREVGMRMAKVGRLPYGLCFVDEFDKIVLFGVIHLHRDPAVWKHRR